MVSLATKLKTIICLLLGVVFFSGCGNGDGYSGPRGTVSGKITVGGAPVPKGTTVVFVGVGKTYMPTGTVEANGEYKLKLNGSTNVPGVKYMVQILPPAEEAAPAQKGTPGKAVDPTAAMQKMMPTKKPDAKAVVEKGPFPAKYTSTATSKLEFEVKAGANTCNFDLDAIKAK